MYEDLKNYDGENMIIRLTNKGKYQVLPKNYTKSNQYGCSDMCQAPVFLTQRDAILYIKQPMPDWVRRNRQDEEARKPHYENYYRILASENLREMRREIQELYSSAAYAHKLAGDHLRAHGDDRHMEHYIDEDASASSEHVKKSLAYEKLLQKEMRESGIPIKLFRSEV